LIFLFGLCAMGCMAIFAIFFCTLFFWIFFRCDFIKRKNILYLYSCIFVVNEKTLLTSCCNCCPATPPAPLDCWVRAGMTYPDLKCSKAERRGVSHEARNTTWLLFWVVAHSDAMSKGITKKAMDRAVPVQQANSRGRIGSRRFLRWLLCLGKPP